MQAFHAHEIGTLKLTIFLTPWYDLLWEAADSTEGVRGGGCYWTAMEALRWNDSCRRDFGQYRRCDVIEASFHREETMCKRRSEI